jgi:succinate dehydrogenase flavin-adding protein (antitoxin of CptAB toxin-antitoxin module)
MKCVIKAVRITKLDRLRNDVIRERFLKKNSCIELIENQEIR